MELPAQGVKSSFTRNVETSYYYYFTSLGGKIFEMEQKARCTYSNCRGYGLQSLLFDIARDYIHCTLQAGIEFKKNLRVRFGKYGGLKLEYFWVVKSKKAKSFIRG